MHKEIPDQASSIFSSTGLLQPDNVAEIFKEAWDLIIGKMLSVCSRLT